MSKKTDLDQLVLLSNDEFEDRIAAAKTRIETRIERCHTEGRPPSDREHQLSLADRDELVALKDADEIRAARTREAQRIDEESVTRSRQLGDAIDTFTRVRDHLSPFMLSADNAARLEDARGRFEAVTVIERAAIATTDMGTSREYSSNGLQAPRSLWRASGIPTTPPDGYAGVVPTFTLPAGVALVAEGVDHAEFDAVAPDTVTIGRAGAWSTLTSEAMLSTSITEISGAHARIIARNVDKATVAKLEDATPATITIDEAMVTVAAEAACDVSDLWIFGAPAAVSALVGNAVFTPASGPDMESYASRYGGAAVYPTPLAAASTLTVFYPQAFRAFATPLASTVLINPKDGGQDFGQWMFYGLGQALVGSAITVTTTP